MTTKKNIFIDTSGWIELVLRGEKYHKNVAEYFEKEVENGSKFLTSDYVLDETFTRLITNQSFNSAKKLKSKIEKARKLHQIMVLFTDEVVFKKAWKNFEKYAKHKLSFTDATITTWVQELRINEICTLDKGFRKIGLTTKPSI